jgi:hypothetical protein
VFENNHAVTCAQGGFQPSAKCPILNVLCFNEIHPLCLKLLSFVETGESRILNFIYTETCSGKRKWGGTQGSQPAAAWVFTSCTSMASKGPRSRISAQSDGSVGDAPAVRI